MKDGNVQETWMEFNRYLDVHSNPAFLNEDFLEDAFSILNGLAQTQFPIRQLTIARLIELALACAGNYADNLEFSLAGDLLFNPKEVSVFIRGQAAPVAKERHTSLSLQFGSDGEAPKEVLNRLAQIAVVRVTKKPLVPRLLKDLEGSHLALDDYVRSVHSRMEKITGTIVTLASWQIQNATQLNALLTRATESDRKFVDSSFCRFGLELFRQLGDTLCHMGHKSEIFVESVFDQVSCALYAEDAIRLNEYAVC